MVTAVKHQPPPPPPPRSKRPTVELKVKAPAEETYSPEAAEVQGAAEVSSPSLTGQARWGRPELSQAGAAPRRRDSDFPKSAQFTRLEDRAEPPARA